MRRFFRIALSAQFVIAMTMAQACVEPSQSGNSYRSNGSYTKSAAPVGGSPAAQNPGPIDTRGYSANQGQSKALTDYLKQHRLPLVGAQVLENPADGKRVAVLYGFVGSDLGKRDAQQQAQSFLDDPAAAVDNRIKVNPDLLTANGAPPAPDGSNKPEDQARAANSLPGVQSYVDQQNQAAAQAQQYQQFQQSQAGNISSMLPLIALLGILGMGMASGGFSRGPSMGSSPFGYSPYSPYSGYPSAPGYPSPFYGGSPFGGSPFGGSPFGSTPFGTPPPNPYYPYP